MLKLLDKMMSLGGLLDGKKTIIGAVAMGLGKLAIMYPQLPFAAVLAHLDLAGEVLAGLGVIHWRIKDLVREE